MKISIWTFLIAMLTSCTSIAPDEFFDDSDILDSDTTLVFVDEIGASRPLGVIRAGAGMAAGKPYVVGYAAAVAARGNDLFIVDRSTRHLMRIDLILNESRVLTTLSDPDTHGVYVSRDLRIYVVDRFSREVRELNSAGQTVRHYSDPTLIPSPIDVAETDWGNAIVIADELSNQLFLFNTLGDAFSAIGPNLSRPSIAQRLYAVAATRKSIYILDPDLGEVSRFDLRGNPLSVYGEDELQAPTALAVDRCGRVFVADHNRRGIFVALADMYRPATRADYGMRLTEPITDLWIDEGFLYIAAGIQGVSIFRIEPPCPAM